MGRDCATASKLWRARALHRDPHNHVAVALTRSAHGSEPVNHGGGKPNQALFLLVGLVLTTNAAERERPGNRFERLDADGDADHALTARGAASANGRSARIRPCNV